MDLINTILKLVVYFGNRLIRHVYWYINLSRIKKGKQFRCEFPIIIEGKGEISIGDNVLFEQKLNIGCSREARLTIGNDCKLGQKSFLRIGQHAHITVGDHVKLEEDIRIYTNNDWIIQDNTVIASGCHLYAREPGQNGKFKVGRGTNIGNNTIIDLTDDVILGNDIAIGPNCTLYTHDHDYQQNRDIPWKGHLLKGSVKIHNGAWIGTGVTILPGVSIGKGAIVAAGSLVTKDVNDFEIVKGIPAKP